MILAVWLRTAEWPSGFERRGSRFLFAMAVGVAAGAVVALYA